MHVPHSTIARLLYVASATLLVVGGTAALLVFLAASRPADPGIVGYRITGDGTLTSIQLEDSRRDVRMLEVDGGRANLAAAELDGWIGSLWRGRRLSYTLATVTVVLSALCAWAARLTAVDAAG